MNDIIKSKIEEIDNKSFEYGVNIIDSICSDDTNSYQILYTTRTSNGLYQQISDYDSHIQYHVDLFYKDGFTCINILNIETYKFCNISIHNDLSTSILSPADENDGFATLITDYIKKHDAFINIKFIELSDKKLLPSLKRFIKRIQHDNIINCDIKLDDYNLITLSIPNKDFKPFIYTIEFTLSKMNHVIYTICSNNGVNKFVYSCDDDKIMTCEHNNSFVAGYLFGIMMNVIKSDKE